MSASEPDGAVVAITTFSLRPGVDPTDFRRFSTELDQPTCQACEVVTSFQVYLETGADDRTPAVVEVMHVSDWAAWVRIKDTDPSFTPVMSRFVEMVDLTTVRTVFTQSIDRFSVQS